MDVFERDGYRLRFTEVVDGKEHKFEYFWEPDDTSEGLLNAWREGDERRKFNAVYLMSQKEDERFVEVFLEAAKLRHFAGKGIAVSGLEKYLTRNRAARKAVFSAINSGDYVLTVAGLQALKGLNTRRSRRVLRRTLRHLMMRPDIMGGANTSTPAALLALAAVESLLSLGEVDFAGDALNRLLHHTDRPVRVQALSVATRFPDSADARAMEQLLAAQVPECILATEVLVRKGDTQKVQVLFEYAQAPDILTRTHAVAALARIGTPETVDALEKLLPKEQDLSLRMQMVYHLILGGRKVDFAPFEEALKAKSPIIRQNAITLLSRMKETEEARSLLLRQKQVEPDEFLRHQLEKLG